MKFLKKLSTCRKYCFTFCTRQTSLTRCKTLQTNRTNLLKDLQVSKIDVLVNYDTVFLIPEDIDLCQNVIN